MEQITSRKNGRVAHFKKLAASGAYRRERGEYVCDGWKLLEEAARWRADIREIIVSGEVKAPLPTAAAVYEVTPEVMEAASPMKTPQGVVFTVGIPAEESHNGLAGAVILENIQDPGNVGAVLRTANAFEIPLVVLTGECADVYSPKTVRASMGAVFRQKTARMGIGELRASDTPIYGAALRRNAVDLRLCRLDGCAVAIGNEGAGLSKELLDICAGTVVIPMSQRCESLNAAVAASLIMWEMAGKKL